MGEVDDKARMRTATAERWATHELMLGGQRWLIDSDEGGYVWKLAVPLCPECGEPVSEGVRVAVCHENTSDMSFASCYVCGVTLGEILWRGERGRREQEEPRLSMRAIQTVAGPVGVQWVYTTGWPNRTRQQDSPLIGTHRVTVCELLLPDGRRYVGQASCDSRDGFTRARGRKVSLKAAMARAALQRDARRQIWAGVWAAGVGR
jgi:hypothetical protein